MTLDVEVAQNVFDTILHDYLGVSQVYKRNFVSYAISTENGKAPLEVPCSIADKLKIDFSMEAREPLSCDACELDPRTEKVLRSANIRMNSILQNVRTRRGTVLLRT